MGGKPRLDVFFFVYKWFYLVLENHCKWREQFVGNGRKRNSIWESKCGELTEDLDKG